MISHYLTSKTSSHYIHYWEFKSMNCIEFGPPVFLCVLLSPTQTQHKLVSVWASAWISLTAHSITETTTSTTPEPVCWDICTHNSTRAEVKCRTEMQDYDDGVEAIPMATLPRCTGQSEAKRPLLLAGLVQSVMCFPWCLTQDHVVMGIKFILNGWDAIRAAIG